MTWRSRDAVLALAAVLGLLTAGGPAIAQERVVALVPFGHVDRGLIQAASRAIEERAQARVRLEPERELPRPAWYAPRKRWRAEKLLESLDAQLPSGAWKTVAITEAEISTNKEKIVDWRVAGLGTIGGPSCVVSAWIFLRHSETTAVLFRRMANLVLHELGHTLGVGHCESRDCVMQEVRGKVLESADSSTGRFCKACHQKLGDGVLKQ
jgi:archaemetzincin